MTEPSVRVIAYEVSLLPQDDINNETWALRVEYRGHDLWAVCRGGKRCLSRDGSWDWESIPSEREDEWLAEHRFGLETAISLAKNAAPHVVVNGMTPDQVMAWAANRGES